MSESSKTFPWHGRTAFISGGASGIGLGLARVLATRGVRIALSDVRRDALEAACDALRREGAEVEPFVLDVADRPGCYATADAVDRRFGKLHYLFNNAGVGEIGTPLDQTPDDVFDWVVNVNLRGVFNGIKAFVPKMRAHGEGGHVVNTSSMAGLITERGWNQGVYSATKAGVIALSKDLRFALEGSGIGVSTYLPGLVRTNLNDNVGALRPVPLQRAAPELPAALAASMMLPEAAGEIVLRGIERNDDFIVTNPELWPRVAAEQEEIRRGFGA